MFNIEKTKKEKLKDLTLQIDALSQSGLNNLKSTNDLAYNLVWNNAEFTPQEICDFLGNEAYKLFQNSYKTQMFIKDLNPNHEILQVPQGWTVDIHEDGTVTCTYTEPVIEETPVIEEEILPTE